jgi:hypothetical protein
MWRDSLRGAANKVDALTEEEWLASDNVTEMYTWLHPSWTKDRRPRPLSVRAATLFTVACVRATPQAAGRTFLLESADLIEQSADTGDRSEVPRLQAEATRGTTAAVGAAGLDTPPHFWALAALRLVPSDVLAYAFHVPLFLLKAIAGEKNESDLRKLYADLLRDVAGNPFRGGRGRQFDRRKRKPRTEPVFRPEWRTDTALTLAKQMYESREFGAMPILADALQDAGCEDPLILTHCRDASLSHVRGCCVIDLVLGKQ